MVKCCIMPLERIRRERRLVLGGQITVWNSREMRDGRWRRLNSVERLVPSPTENSVRKGRDMRPVLVSQGMGSSSSGTTVVPISSRQLISFRHEESIL